MSTLVMMLGRSSRDVHSRALPPVTKRDNFRVMDTTTARYPQVASALRETPHGQAGRTVDLLARMQDLTDLDLHVRTGRAISRTSINQKRSGKSPVRAADLWPLADALAVDVDVLLMAPSAAARWLAEHRAERLDAPEPPGGRQGERRSLEQKGGRLFCSARQHDIWSCKLAGLALAA